MLPTVPMFHVNAWGMPYSCTMAGAKQVFPGSGMIGQPIAELIEAERVTCAAGVPTIWTLLYQHLKEKTLRPLEPAHDPGRRGGRVADHDGELRARLRHHDPARLGHDRDLAAGHRLAAQGARWTTGPRSDRSRSGSSRASRAGVEVRILGDHGEDLPWDGEHVGELAVRGPWIASSYYNNPEAGASFTADGWFRTGDMARIDRDGYVQITDRKKDLIKRKGEWISSVDMENAVLAIRACSRPPSSGGPTRSATRCRSSSSSGATTRIIRSSRRTSSTCSPASSPSGSCRCPRTSTSSSRCPRPASASSTRRSCGSSWPDRPVRRDRRLIPPAGRALPFPRQL